MRGDIKIVISHLSDFRLPKLAPLERLPRRQRVGPSASLDEHSTVNRFENITWQGGDVK